MHADPESRRLHRGPASISRTLAACHGQAPPSLDLRIEIQPVLPLGADPLRWHDGDGARRRAPSAAETPEVEFKFAHDRIQQAAYSLIPEDERPRVHWRLGQLLPSTSRDEQLEQKLFDIVNHLNLTAIALITPEERDELARLNLTARPEGQGLGAPTSGLRVLLDRARLCFASDGWERYEC